jgi:hypothetical protein
MFHGVFKYMVYGSQTFTPNPKPPTPGAATLFLPIITSTYSPLWECDFNFHKSNSTYFSDLDVSRHHLVACLFREGLANLMETDDAILDLEGKPAKGARFMMVGSVSCSFKREISPYVGYEVWSRVLCWDRKWVYVVSHFVKKGTKRPRGYVLKGSSSIDVVNEKASLKENGRARGLHEGFGDIPDKAIYASGIVRYVIKAGRMTVHPVLLLEASGLLPPKPGGWITSTSAEINNKTNQGDVQGDDKEWNWRQVEAENARGMKVAQHLDGLEGTHCEWSGSEWPALDRFTDLF